MSEEQLQRLNESFRRLGLEMQPALLGVGKAMEAFGVEIGKLLGVAPRPLRWYERAYYAALDFFAFEWTPEGFGRE